MQYEPNKNDVILEERIGVDGSLDEIIDNLIELKNKYGQIKLYAETYEPSMIFLYKKDTQNAT